MARKQAANVSAVALVDRVNAAMKGNVITLGNNPTFTIQRIPTGSLVLDRLTYGGFARGRHHCLYGDWMMGKSLVLYRTLALAQMRGESTALIDAENVFNSAWFTQLGGDPSQLALYPRRDGAAKRDANELGNVLRLMLEKGEGIHPADVVGIDSVASLLPSEELEHDLEDGDPRVASLARLMPLLLRMLTTMNDRTTFIWTNQWRDKISRIPNQRSTPGGKALGFFASTMIEMAAGEKETQESEVASKGKIGARKVVKGRWVNCMLAKEKTGARPFSTASFMLDLATNMPSVEREIVDLCLQDGVIDFRGGRYFIAMPDGKEVSVHGLTRLLAKIDSDLALREWLLALITERTEELSAGSANA